MGNSVHTQPLSERSRFHRDEGMGNGAGTEEDSAQITKVMLIKKDSRSHSTEALAVP